MSKYQWQPWQLQLLFKLYPNHSAEEIGELVGLSAELVYRKARFLGYKKSAQYKEQLAKARNEKLESSGIGSRFQKGSQPPNKGKKCPNYPGMQATQFKKGSKPHTWVPVGSYRVTTDGVLEKKLSDVSGPSYLRWTPVHRLIWEEAHGPIPKGMVLAFKPGRKSVILEQVTLDALELISRKELMARNTIHNYPPELSDVMRARGILKRAINTKLKEAKS
jgi:hypothetical protein